MAGRDSPDGYPCHHFVAQNDTKMVEYIIALGGQIPSGDPESTMEIFSHLQNRWTNYVPMHTPRSRVGVSVLNGQLYAIGGYNGIERLNNVEIFDPLDQKWTPVASLSCPRSALGVAALGDKIYACGGYDGTSSSDSLECYTRENNSWKPLSKMAKPRSALALASLGGLIYALGGHDGRLVCNSVERYDSLTDSWQEITSMQTKRCRFGAAVLDDKLYVAALNSCVDRQQLPAVLGPQVHISPMIACGAVAGAFGVYANQA
ncbi:kelch-like protein 18 [Watersipora subatra]|uniref:kelch-like protein 18 n=1 Tax=Watersipora subatra TaxID=2589382 RepID=UPI00355B58B5